MGTDADLAADDSARELARQCGYLPVMLQSLGVMCRPPSSIAEVLRLMAEHREVMRVPVVEGAGGYDYDNFYKATEIQLCFLEAKDRELALRYRMLAVLQEDDRLPLDTAAMLWGVDKPTARATAMQLAGQHLVKWEAAAATTTWPREPGVAAASTAHRGRFARPRRAFAPRLPPFAPRLPPPPELRGACGRAACAEALSLLDLHWSYLVHRERNSLPLWHAAMVRGWMEGCGEVLTRQDGEYWRKSLNHHVAGAGGAVTIPDSVTSIGDCAFEGCSGLTSVTIPASVTSIGFLAFEGCSGLTSVIIPDSVSSIGDCAFRGCSGLASVTIPASVTSIGEGALYRCTGLTSVIIPDSVTSIGRSAFEGCSGLTSVIIPASVTSIGSDAFRGCSGLTITVASVTLDLIGIDAFSGCTVLTPAASSHVEALL
jgi:CBS domain-containing protein